jgi:putative ABC transport system permease protein
MDASVIDRIAGATGVEWVVGFGPAVDMRNYLLPGGQSCSVRPLLGTLPTEQFDLAIGRPAANSEILVTAISLTCLGLAQPTGSVEPVNSAQSAVPPGPFGVVGLIEFGDALDDQEPFAFINLAGAIPVTQLIILAQTIDDVPMVTKAAMSLTGASAGDINVVISTSLVELNETLAGTLAVNTRIAGGAALLTGMSFIAIAIALSVGSQRRDFGRRRALGASRSFLVSSVLVETSAPTTLGVVFGTAVSLLIMAIADQPIPSIGFVASVPTLSLIASIVATIPSALLAALRNPVSILRVP